MSTSARCALEVRWRRAACALVLLGLLGPSPGLGAQELPTLILEAPPELAGLAERLRSFERERLTPAMRLTGLTDPGPPIRVVLASETSALARRPPAWAAGYADGAAGLVVVLGERVPTYPDSSVEALLQHEVAHVLIARAAAPGSVPRWFNEGVAMAAGHAWSLEERARVTLDMVSGGGGSFAELDRAFTEGQRRAQGAYALSYAFVRDLERRYGGDAVARVLAEVREGFGFEAAYLRATGESLAAAEERFWGGMSLWNRWLPILGSSSVVWIAAALLALAAFRRRRARIAEQMRRLDEEDERRAQAQRDRAGRWLH